MSFKHRAMSSRKRPPRIEFSISLASDNPDFAEAPQRFLANHLSEVEDALRAGHQRGNVNDVIDRVSGAWEVTFHDFPEGIAEHGIEDWSVEEEDGFTDGSFEQRDRSEAWQPDRGSPGDLRLDRSKILKPKDVPDDYPDRVRGEHYPPLKPPPSRPYPKIAQAVWAWARGSKRR